MSRKHFIIINDIFIMFFNELRTKKELILLSKMLMFMVGLCKASNDRFNSNYFYQRLAKNIKPKQITLLKRFNLEF